MRSSQRFLCRTCFNPWKKHLIFMLVEGARSCCLRIIVDACCRSMTESYTFTSNFLQSRLSTSNRQHPPTFYDYYYFTTLPRVSYLFPSQEEACVTLRVCAAKLHFFLHRQTRLHFPNFYLTPTSSTHPRCVNRTLRASSNPSNHSTRVPHPTWHSRGLLVRPSCPSPLRHRRLCRRPRTTSVERGST